MNRIAKFAVCLALTLQPCAVAQNSSDPIRRGLERAADAIARIERTLCHVDQQALFESAIEAVNAMPERSSRPRASLQAPGIEEFGRVYGSILSEPGTDIESIELVAVRAMAKRFDSEGDYDLFRNFDYRGEVMLTLEPNSDFPVVVAAAEGGPAAMAGIVPGDRLAAIDGQTTQGVSMRDITKRLRGAADSTTRLTILRDGEQSTISVQRQRVTDGSEVRGVVINGVGIVSVHSFQYDAARQVNDAMARLRAENPNLIGYVLDLRGNEGGLLDQSIAVADVFLGDDDIARVVAAGDCHLADIQAYKGRAGDQTHGKPLAVLVNADTASGAELVAAALREQRGARLIGQRCWR